MREANRVKSSLKLIENYHEESSKSNNILPFSLFLSQYFRANRQMGSTDRRVVGGLVYNFFRTGNLFLGEAPLDRLFFSNYLCADQESDELNYLQSLLNFCPSVPMNASCNEKLMALIALKCHLEPNEIFPFSNFIPSKLKTPDFYCSFLAQPQVWLRIKKDKRKDVLEELRAENIEIQEYSDHPYSISLLNGKNLDYLKSRKNGLLEVQDFSSQRTGELFRAKDGEIWWDCCAGAGGKTLLLAEDSNNTTIYASDSRPSILVNLKNRLSKSRRKIHCFSADLLGNYTTPFSLGSLDGIIVDAPCSGSGTWGRAPEMLGLFKSDSIKDYAIRQKAICKEALQFLQIGKPLVYITCSIFTEENEEVVHYLHSELKMEIEQQVLIEGYRLGADNMFATRLIKK